MSVNLLITKNILKNIDEKFYQNVEFCARCFFNKNLLLNKTKVTNKNVI